MHFIDYSSLVGLSCVVECCFIQGKNGQLNSLENIGFLEDIFVDFTKFKMPLMFGAPAHCDTAICRDASFSELKKVYEKLLSQLAKER